jgi:hypothetical protein
MPITGRAVLLILEIVRPIYAAQFEDFSIPPIFAVRKQQNANLMTEGPPPPRIIQRHTFSLKDAERYHRSCPVI